MSKSKRLTLEDAYLKEIFKQKAISLPVWMKDGRRLSFVEEKSLWVFNAETGTRAKILDESADWPKGWVRGVTNYLWSPDETRLLLNQKAKERFTPQGDYAVYDLASKQIAPVTHCRKGQMNGKFSPDGKRIGFVRGDDLWTVDLASGEEIRLTSLAGANLYAGRFGWVYEEELGLVDGWAWSPDGRWLAFYQVDERKVPEFIITDNAPQHPAYLRTRYPKAGDPNPIVRIGVMPAAGGDIVWLETGHEADGYLSRMQWSPKSKLLIQRMPRLQNRLDLLVADPETGKCRVALTERSETWVDGQGDLVFLGDGQRFLWFSDRDGWRHVYLCDLKGNQTQLTSGEFDVTGIAGADDEHALLYYVAAAPKPYERNLYAVSLSGGKPSRITTGRGDHTAQMGKGAKCFLSSASDADTPPTTAINTAGGKLVQVLAEPKVAGLDRYEFSKWEFLSFKTADGVRLNARMLKPLNFDPSKRYPVLMHTYGGPGSQVVMDRWGADWLSLYLAQQGYISFLVDGRGSGGRGAAFMKRLYRQLGTWEPKDQIEGANWLGKQPFVDARRIAIWGWSYGGFNSSLAMLLGGDTFRACMSVAPVTHYELYDTIYTERYMQTPALNPEGYREGAPETHADKLRGALLIVHGTADDNVHFQNSARLAAALQKANKPFETMFYPGKKHGIEGMRYHIYKMLERFLKQNM